MLYLFQHGFQTEYIFIYSDINISLILLYSLGSGHYTIEQDVEISVFSQLAFKYRKTQTKLHSAFSNDKCGGLKSNTFTKYQGRECLSPFKLLNKIL